MKDINLTALGIKGSGKTCFLLGMYYEMSAGVNGYTMTTVEDQYDIELRRKWKKINETQGPSRFPTGTDRNEDYQFNLEYAHKKINSFHWMDYKGGIMETRGMEGEEEGEYDELSKRIKESDCLCIFVDGKLFCKESEQDIVRNVRDNCSSMINHFISNYQEENGHLPPVAIVVTKYDLCKDFVTEVQQQNVIKKAFPSLFTSERNSKVTIIPVSIGMHIEDQEYGGSLEPINIYKPLFFGIYEPLLEEWKKSQNKQKSLQKQLADKEAEYDVLKKKLLYKRKKKELGVEVAHLKDEVRKASKREAKYKKYVDRVHRELEGLPLFHEGKQSVITEMESEL